MFGIINYWIGAVGGRFQIVSRATFGECPLERARDLRLRAPLQESLLVSHLGGTPVRRACLFLLFVVAQCLDERVAGRSLVTRHHRHVKTFFFFVSSAILCVLLVTFFSDSYLRLLRYFFVIIFC